MRVMLKSEREGPGVVRLKGEEGTRCCEAQGRGRGPGVWEAQGIWL